MRDPIRLADDPATSRDASELLRELAPPQAPPPAVQAALSQKLASMAATGAAGAAGAAATSASKLWLLPLLAAGAGGALVLGLSRVSEPPPAAAPGPALSAARSSAPPPAPQEAEALPPEPAVSSEVTELAPTVQKAAPQAERRDKLAEEEALLEQARHALGSDPRRALSLLRQHQSQFSGGQLAAERMYLMVDCLARLGQRAEARRHADALLRHYPKSVYARRAPRLLGDVE